jgi:hypothetical protein
MTWTATKTIHNHYRDNTKPLFTFKHNQQKKRTDLAPNPTNSPITFKHHRGKLWKNKKNNPKQKQKTGLASGSAVAGVDACRTRATTGDLLCNRNPPEDPETTRGALEDKPWPTQACPGSGLHGTCRPHANREELARLLLEATEPEETGYHRGEEHVLEKPTKVSRSDSKERNQNKEKLGQKLRQIEAHQKNAPQPKSREVFYWGKSTTTGSNSGKQKLHIPKGWKTRNLHWI